jgi:hypothetical protein
MMEEKKVITVELLKAGVSSRTGLDYTDALALFQEKHPKFFSKSALRGEYCMPRVVLPVTTKAVNHIVREDRNRAAKFSYDVTMAVPAARIIQIYENNVSHALDNFRVEDGVLKADATPCGPHADLFEQLHERGALHFGMRAFTRLQGNKVLSIENIVTFDLVSTPL